MIEGLFFLLELVAILLLLRAVFQEGRLGGKADLGVFAYLANLSQEKDVPPGGGPRA